MNKELPFLERYYTYFWSNDPTEIEPGLFIGSAKNAADSNALDRNGIQLVINVTKGIRNFFDGREERLIYYRVPLEDCKESTIEDSRVSFDEAVERLHGAFEKKEPVLVHCYAGASRSVAVVCAYYCKYRGMVPGDAYAFVREKRACAALNENFMAWLKKEYEGKYEEKCEGKCE